MARTNYAKGNSPEISHNYRIIIGVRYNAPPTSCRRSKLTQSPLQYMTECGAFPDNFTSLCPLSRISLLSRLFFLLVLVFFSCLSFLLLSSFSILPFFYEAKILSLFHGGNLTSCQQERKPGDAAPKKCRSAFSAILGHSNGSEDLRGK